MTTLFYLDGSFILDHNKLQHPELDKAWYYRGPIPVCHILALSRSGRWYWGSSCTQEFQSLEIKVVNEIFFSYPSYPSLSNLLSQPDIGYKLILYPLVEWFDLRKKHPKSFGISMYTVHKCKSKSNDAPVGPNHGSNDSKKTLCGYEITPDWFINSSNYDGNVTCSKCIQALEKVGPAN